MGEKNEGAYHQLSIAFQKCCVFGRYYFNFGICVLFEEFKMVFITSPPKKVAEGDTGGVINTTMLSTLRRCVTFCYSEFYLGVYH